MNERRSSLKERLSGKRAYEELPISKPADYYQIYEATFGPWRTGDVRLLEMGVAEGDSVRVWLDWFPNGQIAGLDLNEPPQLGDLGDRLHLYRGSQDDTALLDRIAREVAPEGFDIIIDDASHIGWLSAASFWHLFPNHLKSGGIYVIEDWMTGYWPGWRTDGRRFRGKMPPSADSVASLAARPIRQLHTRRRRVNRLRYRLGVNWPLSNIRSHQGGMVGVVKQIVDAIAVDSIRFGNPDAVVGDTSVAWLEIRS